MGVYLKLLFSSRVRQILDEQHCGAAGNRARAGALTGRSCGRLQLGHIHTWTQQAVQAHAQLEKSTPTTPVKSTLTTLEGRRLTTLEKSTLTTP